MRSNIKQFNEAEDPKLVLELYSKANNTLYDRLKNDLLMRICLPFLNGKRVLDIGCGPGYFLTFFAKNGATVTGLDSSMGCISAARYYAKERNVLHKCNLILGDAREFKSKEKFDLIFAKDIIEHLDRNEDFVKSLWQHLKKGGVLVLSTQNSFSLNYLIEGGYKRIIKKEKDWKGWDRYHLGFYTPVSLKRLLKKAGFQIIRFYGAYHIPYRFLSRLFFNRVIEHHFFHIIEKIAPGVFPFNRMGWSLITLCKKG